MKSDPLPRDRQRKSKIEVVERIAAYSTEIVELDLVLKRKEQART